jgi:hypothetical protein
MIVYAGAGITAVAILVPWTDSATQTLGSDSARLMLRRSACWFIGHRRRSCVETESLVLKEKLQHIERRHDAYQALAARD